MHYILHQIWFYSNNLNRIRQGKIEPYKQELFKQYTAWLELLHQTFGETLQQERNVENNLLTHDTQCMNTLLPNHASTHAKTLSKLVLRKLASQQPNDWNNVTK